MNRSDQQLIAEYLAGDEKPLEVLFGQYLKPIFSFACRYVGGGHDASDKEKQYNILNQINYYEKKT